MMHYILRRKWKKHRQDPHDFMKFSFVIKKKPEEETQDKESFSSCMQLAHPSDKSKELFFNKIHTNSLMMKSSIKREHTTLDYILSHFMFFYFDETNHVEGKKYWKESHSVSHHSLYVGLTFTRYKAHMHQHFSNIFIECLSHWTHWTLTRFKVICFQFMKLQDHRDYGNFVETSEYSEMNFKKVVKWF